MTENLPLTFSANNELALHVNDPGGRRRILNLRSRLLTRPPHSGWIELTSGALRLYLVRDPALVHEAVVPSFDAPDRAAAIAALKGAGCALVPIGPHAPDGYYVRDPFGVLFDVVERSGGDGGEHAN